MSDDIFQRLRAAYSKPTSAPPGFKNRHEIGKELGLQQTAVKALLLKGVRDGRLSVVQVNVKHRIMNYYGPPDKSTSTRRPRRL